MAACRRVVVLGPSHHVHLDNCVLTRASTLETPLGSLRVDVESNAALMATGLFAWFGLEDDEEEHSIEMHLPFLHAGLAERGIDPATVSVLPIVVGDLTRKQHAEYARALVSLFRDPATVFAISTDFCHWGRRFRYAPYDASAGPIHNFIRGLDHEGMAVRNESFDIARI